MSQFLQTYFRVLVFLILLGACFTFPVSSMAANGAIVYTYDALGRVLTASYDTGIIVIYAYDSNGNRTQQIVNINTTNLTWTATGTSCATNCWGLALW